MKRIMLYVLFLSFVVSSGELFSQERIAPDHRGGEVRHSAYTRIGARHHRRRVRRLKRRIHRLTHRAQRLRHELRNHRD